MAYSRLSYEEQHSFERQITDEIYNSSRLTVDYQFYDYYADDFYGGGKLLVQMLTLYVARHQTTEHPVPLLLLDMEASGIRIVFDTSLTPKRLSTRTCVREFAKCSHYWSFTTDCGRISTHLHAMPVEQFHQALLYFHHELERYFSKLDLRMKKPIQSKDLLTRLNEHLGFRNIQISADLLQHEQKTISVLNRWLTEMQTMDEKAVKVKDRKYGLYVDESNDVLVQFMGSDVWISSNTTLNSLNEFLLKNHDVITSTMNEIEKQKVRINNLCCILDGQFQRCSFSAWPTNTKQDNEAIIDMLEGLTKFAEPIANKLSWNLPASTMSPKIYVYICPNDKTVVKYEPNGTIIFYAFQHTMTHNHSTLNNLSNASAKFHPIIVP